MKRPRSAETCLDVMFGGFRRSLAGGQFQYALECPMRLSPSIAVGRRALGGAGRAPPPTPSVPPSPTWGSGGCGTRKLGSSAARLPWSGTPDVIAALVRNCSNRPRTSSDADGDWGHRWRAVHQPHMVRTRAVQGVVVVADARGRADGHGRPTTSWTTSGSTGSRSSHACLNGSSCTWCQCSIPTGPSDSSGATPRGSTSIATRCCCSHPEGLLAQEAPRPS